MRLLNTIFLLLFIALNVNAQRLSGTYVYQSKSDTIKLSFWGNRFNQVITGTMGQTTGSGTYSYESGNLSLFFGESDEPDSLAYKLILDKTKDSNIVHLKVNIYDGSDNNKPLKGATCILTNIAGNTVLANFAGNDGHSDMIIYDTKLFKSIKITALGYQSVTIPLFKIKGNIATIDVTLREVQQMDRKINHVTTFKLAPEVNNKGFILTSKTGERLPFKWIYTPMIE
ncbi:hypothetical protein [Pedobacter nototheniae]|uniref:hypothetical protein n=1 Tax=Pedobacter nototheniae TaxID=2488994 RepID=UPI00103C5B78|nr:hypothetical protein [Pedobacter nototheniae]